MLYFDEKDNKMFNFLGFELIMKNYDHTIFFSNYEQAVVGIVDKLDVDVYCLKEFKRLIDNENMKTGKFFISKEISFSLLKICQKNALIPYIGHTHPIYYKDLYVSFSEGDMKFIEAFVKVAKKLNVNELFFTVTNGVYIRNIFYTYDKVYSWIERSMRIV